MPLVLDFNHEIHIIFSTGIFLSFFALYFWFLDVKKRKNIILKHITIFSSLAFTIFVAHHLFARYFFGPIFRSALAEFDITYLITNPFIKTLFFQFIMQPANLVSTYTLQIFTIVFTIFFWIVTVFWTRFKLKYSIEWVIRKLS